MPLSSRSTPGCWSAPSHPALVVGHPGHELKVFGWMARHSPRVYVITDGSGRHGISRTPSTAALIAQLGARPAETFGALSDAAIYRAMLERDVPLFLRLADGLAGSFVKHQIDLVAGDAAEGFNPTHDLCRALINAAVLRAERMTGRSIANFEFCLTEWEQHSPDQKHDGRCTHLTLDDRALANKLAAAQSYVELRDEVRGAIARRGEEYFRVECFRKVLRPALARPYSTKPLYETWGERRVAAGEYQSVVRFKQHILPIMRAVLDYAAHGTVEAFTLSRGA